MPKSSPMISVLRNVLIITMLMAFVNSNKLFASKPLSKNIHPKPWKITEQQFLDKYGKHDSSQALIHYYFEERKQYKKRTFMFTGISGISGILFAALIERPGGSALGALVLGIPLLAGLWFFGFGIIIETARWIGMSRKALFKMLNNYQNGKEYRKESATSIAFRIM